MFNPILTHCKTCNEKVLIKWSISANFMLDELEVSISSGINMSTLKARVEDMHLLLLLLLFMCVGEIGEEDSTPPLMLLIFNFCDKGTRTKTNDKRQTTNDKRQTTNDEQLTHHHTVDRVIHGNKE